MVMWFWKTINARNKKVTGRRCAGRWERPGPRWELGVHSSRWPVPALMTGSRARSTRCQGKATVLGCSNPGLALQGGGCRLEPGGAGGEEGAEVARPRQAVPQVPSPERATSTLFCPWTERKKPGLSHRPLCYSPATRGRPGLTLGRGVGGQLQVTGLKTT